MNFKGIEFDINNVPELDKGFVPLAKWGQAYHKKAEALGKAKPIAIAVTRNNGLVSVFDTCVIDDAAYTDANRFYVERTVKALLWIKGGYKVDICGDEDLAAYIKSVYKTGGERGFDADFMGKVYENPFEVNYLPLDKKPSENELSRSVGRHMDGYRIGFDAGGSDRKVSAVVNGEAIWSEEVVWFPKQESNPDYHFEGIVDAMKSAAAKMPRVDAIGVSSAGIYIDNRTAVASLFLKVSEPDFNAKVKDIFIRAAKAVGDVPLEVANDGDVTALAGAMSLDENNILGIAMGTSEAGGYVDKDGNITGWLNELAFVPADGQPEAMIDEWSGDIGCGVKYFSQDGVIKLAPAAGITLDATAPLGEQLKAVQDLMAAGDPRPVDLYKTIGAYLGHNLAYYAVYYDIKHVLLMGRVVSGEGGNIILDVAKKTLSEDYPELAKTMNVHLPDEKSRRVGQSVAAASLPEIK